MCQLQFSIGQYLHSSELQKTMVCNRQSVPVARNINLFSINCLLISANRCLASFLPSKIHFRLYAKILINSINLSLFFSFNLYPCVFPTSQMMLNLSLTRTFLIFPSYKGLPRFFNQISRQNSNLNNYATVFLGELKAKIFQSSDIRERERERSRNLREEFYVKLRFSEGMQLVAVLMFPRSSWRIYWHHK